MQAPGLIGELDTEGDQRGGNREKRNGGKGKNSGKKMGDGNGSSIVRRDRDRRTDGKRPEAQIDLFRRSGRDRCHGRGHGTVLPQ